MRIVALGALIIAGLVVAAVGLAADPGEALAQRLGSPNPARASGELIALSTMVGDKYQQVTVIDPKQQVMSVYHIELATGAVELRCVRNIHWDLQMTYFNGKGLSPLEIQSQTLQPR